MTCHQNPGPGNKLFIYYPRTKFNGGTARNSRPWNSAQEFLTGVFTFHTEASNVTLSFQMEECSLTLTSNGSSL